MLTRSICGRADPCWRAERRAAFRNVFAHLRPYAREPKWVPAPVRGKPSAVIGMTAFWNGNQKAAVRAWAHSVITTRRRQEIELLVPSAP